MVTIPYCVKDLLEDQGIFVVGSTGDTKICNISPRVFFDITENSIYWLDFFKHKSHQNFKQNPWVSIAVFDKDEFVGYQLRGEVSVLIENSETEKIRKKIVQQTLQKHKSKKDKRNEYTRFTSHYVRAQGHLFDESRRTFRLICDM